MAKLTVTSGPNAGQEIELEGELVIGRENADVVLPDEELSRRHVALRLRDAGVEIQDLGSLNGTFVKGKRIDAPVTLTESTSLRVGTTELAVDIPVPEPADAGATREGQVIAMGEPTVAREVVSPDERPVPDQTARDPIVDPDVTAQRPIADPDVTAQRPIADPDVTAQRPVVPKPDLTAQRPVAGQSDELPAAAKGARRITPPVLAAIVGVAVAVVLLVLLLG